MKKVISIGIFLGVIVAIGYVLSDHQSATDKVAEELRRADVSPEIAKSLQKSLPSSPEAKQETKEKDSGKQFNETNPSRKNAPEQDEDLNEKYESVVLKTTKGEITIILFAKDAPQTVTNFLTLSLSDFYDNTKFHRVIPNFMIQGGDPNSRDNNFSDDGIGGPGYVFPDEINQHKLVRGSLAMANSGSNTNGSQFFIVTKDETPWLDGKHTVFGTVIDGMDVVDAMEAVAVDRNDHPVDDITIEDIMLLEK